MPLFVLEGLDGSGKSTQLEMLRDRASGLGHSTEFLHFPRTGTPVYGELITGFLRGDLGRHDEVDPYLVALLFAGDRAEAEPMLGEWLADGKYVFLDRYVYSNVGYQCAKVDDQHGRKELKDWILNLEFSTYGIPIPDVSLFLDVPFPFIEACLTSKREGSDRDYLKGGCDIHESSLDFQRRVREVYLEAAAEDLGLRIVDCSDGDGLMLPKEDIFHRILSNIGSLL